MELLGRETARSAVGSSPRSRSESFNSAILTRCHAAGGCRIARSARSGSQGWRVCLWRLTCRAADQPAQPEMTHSEPSGVAAPHLPAGRSALGVSGINASASVTSGHTNRAAVAEKSIGEPTFDLTGTPVASCAQDQSSRRSSEQPRCCADQEPCEVSPPHRHSSEANVLRPPKLHHAV